MRIDFRTPLVPAIAAALLLSAAALAQREERITPNDVAKKKGYTLEGLTNIDVDGDGRSESVAACRARKGLRLCVFGENDKGATWAGEADWARGSRFKSLEGKDLVKEIPGQELILEVYDETPDEKVKRVRVYSAKPTPRELFQSVIYRSKMKSDRPEWERDDVVKYGDARSGWYFQDIDDDGDLEVLVRRKPQLLSVETEAELRRILLGVPEAVFKYDAGKKAYAEQKGGRFVDFVPPYDVVETRASSAYIPPEVLDDMRAEAIAEQMARASEGKAAKDVQVDRKAFISTVADRDFDTSWIEDAKGVGKGEWIELELAEKSTIHMVRVVAGCTESKSTFLKHNIPTSFTLRFDGGESSKVDLYAAKTPNRPAVGILLRPIKEKDFAKQTLVFFNGKFKSKKVRLIIEGAKRLGKGDLGCITEISVH